MELRDIEVFLTLAEELHFGRTAERLHLTQARVSQIVQKIERRIGGTAFERTSRRVALTPLGEQLRDDLVVVRVNLRQSLERAVRTAQGKTGVLHVGAINGNAHELLPFWEAFRARHPQWGLQIRHASFIDPFEPLRLGEIDVLIAWHPVQEPDLTTGPVIFTEPMVAMMAPHHRLTEHKCVSLEAFGDHGLFGATKPQPDYWEDAFSPFRTPSGRPIERVHQVATCEEVPTIVATSDAIDITSGHATRYYARPGITYRPVYDAPLLRWGLVWRSGAETAPLHAFAQVVRDLGTLAL